MKAIHKAVGSYTLCGRFLRDTMIAGDVPTCKYCIAGGVGPHKKVVAILKESTPSTDQEDDLAIRDYSRFKDSKLFKTEQESQEEEFLLHLVDVVASFATEQNMFYATSTRKELIQKARETFPYGVRG